MGLLTVHESFPSAILENILNSKSLAFFTSKLTRFELKSTLLSTTSFCNFELVVVGIIHLNSLKLSLYMFKKESSLVCSLIFSSIVGEMLYIGFYLLCLNINSE